MLRGDEHNELGPRATPDRADSAPAAVNHPRSRGQDGTTPLFVASQDGSVEIVLTLVEGRADLDAAKNVGDRSRTLRDEARAH